MPGMRNIPHKQPRSVIIKISYQWDNALLQTAHSREFIVAGFQIESGKES